MSPIRVYGGLLKVRLGLSVKRLAGYAFLTFVIIILAGFLLPQHLKIPVKGATSKSWNPKSFWYYPWGQSVTHKGIDIFAREGTPVLSSIYGLVLYSGDLGIGGNIVLILVPKWRFHYFAHLKEIKIKHFRFVRTGDTIGTVGTIGNAKGTPPHLHYAIVTLFPYVWRIDQSPHGRMKAFFLNPIDHLPEKP